MAIRRVFRNDLSLGHTDEGPSIDGYGLTSRRGSPPPWTCHILSSERGFDGCCGDGSRLRRSSGTTPNDPSPYLLVRLDPWERTPYA